MRLVTLRKVMALFQKVYPDMPLPMLLTFIEVASADGLTVSDVVERVGISQPAASRHCRALSEFATPNKPGFNLVEFRESRADFRCKYVYLNENGRALAKKIKDIR